MGIKITHFKKNKKLERELQQKINHIMLDSKYRDIPMVFINACKIEETEDALLDISKRDYNFIFTNNRFKGVSGLLDKK